MLWDQPEDEDILAYCSEIVADLSRLSVFGEPVRALLDKKAIKAANKRWNWVKKGAPVIVEVGGRDLTTQNVSVLRRHRLYNEASKLDSQTMSRDDFLGAATAILQDVQQSLYDQANAFLQPKIDRKSTRLNSSHYFASRMRSSALKKKQ